MKDRWPRISASARVCPRQRFWELTRPQMKKAISLDVRLWIESEDEPAHDFAESTLQAVREIIEAGAANYPALTIKIRSMKEKS